jgi:hypothetical protein
MVKKSSSKSKDFNDEAHYQGSLKVPLPAKKEYGTGLPYKKPRPKMAIKKK